MSDRPGADAAQSESSVEAIGISGAVGVWQIALGEQTANFLGPDDESVTVDREAARTKLELACLPFGATTLTLKTDPQATFTVSAAARDRIQDWVGPLTVADMSRVARPISTVGIFVGLLLLVVMARGINDEGIDSLGALIGSALVIAGVSLRVAPQPALAALHVVLMAATVGKSIWSMTQGGSLIWHGTWGLVCLLVASNLYGRARTLQFYAAHRHTRGSG